MQPNDDFKDNPFRVTLFEYKRYRVTKTLTSGVYTMWYGGTILVIDNNRHKVVDRFKNVMENFEAIAS